MYNSFMILLMGTIPFLIAGLPVGYWLNARLTEHPAAEVTYAYALFAGYVLYAVPTMYLARAGIPVRVFAWILLAGDGAGLVWFLVRMKKAGKLKELVPPVWFVLSALAIILVVNFGFLTMDPLCYRLDDFSDLRYYAAAGEAWKTIPHKDWQAAYSENNALWLSWASICNDGMERICAVMLFSLISSWAGVDASAVSGAVGNIAVLFVFAGAVCFLEGTKVGDRIKAAAYVWAALCPMVIISMLNCFLPMTMMVGGTLFACTFFVKVLAKRDIPTAIAAGIFIGVFVETVLDGLYVLTGLYALTLVCLLFAGRVRLRELRYSVLTAMAAPMTVLPVMRYLLRELFGTNSVRTAFNVIYSFAYSRVALTYAFFGTRLTGRGSRYILVITIVSFILLFIGVTGLILFLLKTKNLRYANILAVFALSFIFLALEYEAQYAFYKVLQLSFPGIVIGTWLFVEAVRKELLRTGKQSGLARYRAASAVLIACVLAVELYSIGMSGGHLRRCTIEYSNERDSNANMTYLTKDGRPNWDILEEVHSIEGRDILYVNNHEESHAQSLFAYMARGNRIWYLDPETYALSRIPAYGWENVSPGEDVPEDAEIYIEDGKEGYLLNKDERGNFAVMLAFYTEGRDDAVTLDGSPASGVTGLRLDAFTRKERNVRLVLDVKSADGEGNVTLTVTDGDGGASYAVLPPEGETMIELSLKAGRSTILLDPVEGQVLSLNEYRLEER